MIKVGFTGTAEGMSDTQKAQFKKTLASLPVTEFHHGDCVGADAEANGIACELDINIIIHPPENGYKRAYCSGASEILPAKPYLERNHDIVDAVDVLFVAPKTNEEQRRSGTWATYRYAKKVGRNIVLLAR